MTAHPETCLIDHEDGIRTMITLEGPSDANSEVGAIACLTVAAGDGDETRVGLSLDAVDVLIERLRELRGEDVDTRDDAIRDLEAERQRLARIVDMLQRCMLPSDCPTCDGRGSEPPHCPESGPCEMCGGWTAWKRDRAAQVVPELPVVALGDSVRGADDGDDLSIEARSGGDLPLLWMRTAQGDDEPSSSCVALRSDALLRLAALCIAHWRERQGKRG